MTLRQQAAAIFAAACCVLPAACTPPDFDGGATVMSVVDGDTLVVRMAGRTETVRLIGVDTPETVHPSKPVECFGPEASARTAALLPKGTRITVVRDAEARDRYGRLLLYVTRAADGLFVNLDIVEQGYAVPLSIEPNTAHQRDFAEAAHRASTARLGLWGACDR
ncbi:MAG: thermonuclease family protein [Ilumatobacteraceae bacterium]